MVTMKKKRMTEKVVSLSCSPKKLPSFEAMKLFPKDALIAMTKNDDGDWW
jgi:hypothetical protein